VLQTRFEWKKRSGARWAKMGGMPRNAEENELRGGRRRRLLFSHMRALGRGKNEGVAESIEVSHLRMGVQGGRREVNTDC
jgi:hypothetical protein